MKINNTGLGEKMELVTELKTRDEYMNFCLENGAVGDCAKNRSEVRQANKDRLIEMAKWICDNYKTYLEYTKESANMNKTKEYVEGMKEHLESDKIIDLSACEDDGINYINILNELDNQNIKYRTENYYNEHHQLKSLPSASIYCEQLYIEQ